MKLALIPPICYLQDVDSTRIQLMLPHMLDDPLYEKKYLGLMNRSNQYVIMDNGAAESVQLTDERLLHYAITYRPHEIALPDVLADSQKTIDNAFTFLKGAAGDLAKWDIKPGLVAQGETVAESVHTVRSVYETKVGRENLKVVYIPRLLLRYGTKYARIEVANRLNELYPELELHLFGAAPEWPGEAYEAGQKKFIRSMDTSMPYNYAYNKRWLRPITSKLVSRPANYFYLGEDEFLPEFVDKNVETMKRWARGTYWA